VADGRCADPVDGSAHQLYAPTQPLLRGQAHSAVMPLLFALHLGPIPPVATHHAAAGGFTTYSALALDRRRVPHDCHSRLRADAATTADGGAGVSRQRAGPVASRKASTAMIRRFISFSSMMPSFWNIEPMCFSTARSLI
jgi:hypothetical protein